MFIEVFIIDSTKSIIFGNLLIRNMKRIAIIGTGITGLSLANSLKNAKITFFDKSRKAGGRISTRQTRQFPNLSFDHGLHYLHADAEDNSQLIKKLKQQKLCKQVQIGYMSKYGSKQDIHVKKIIIGKKNAQSISDQLINLVKSERHFDTRISGIIRDKQSMQYFLKSEKQQTFGPYDNVYACIPHQQCLMLQQDIGNTLDLEILKADKVQYICNWVIMLAVQGKWRLNSQENRKVHEYGSISDKIGKAVNQNIKNGKIGEQFQDMWVFNMADKWSEQNVNKTAQQVQQFFRKQLQNVIDEKINPVFLKAHRWLYAFPKNGFKQPIISKDGSLAFSGDWVGCSRHAGLSWQMGKLLAQKSKL